MLSPNSTNLVTCLSCGWARILDPERGYRGGHTNPDTEAECHEPLLYLELDPRAPEIVLLGEEAPLPTVAQINVMDPADRLAAVFHRDDVLARLAAIYPDADRARGLLDQARATMTANQTEDAPK